MRGLLVILLVVSGLRVMAGDHEQVRSLMQSGEIMPLEQLLVTIRDRYPGRLLEVELEREQGRMVYEIEMLVEGGQVRGYYFDAVSGELLGVEEED